VPVHSLAPWGEELNLHIHRRNRQSRSRTCAWWLKVRTLSPSPPQDDHGSGLGRRSSRPCAGVGALLAQDSRRTSQGLHALRSKAHLAGKVMENEFVCERRRWVLQAPAGRGSGSCRRRRRRRIRRRGGLDAKVSCARGITRVICADGSPGRSPRGRRFYEARVMPQVSAPGGAPP
jgi:hypothetical protein